MSGLKETLGDIWGKAEQLGKAAYNTVIESAPGLTRFAASAVSPWTRMATDAANDLGLTNGANRYAGEKRINDAADYVASVVDPFTATLKKNPGAFYRDEQGNWHVDGDGLAQGIGSGVASLAMMALTRSAVGRVSGTAIRTAQANGMTEVAADLIRRRATMQKASGFLASLAPQAEQTYQSALEATKDPAQALFLTGVVSPAVSAIDSFLGAGGMVNGGVRRELSRDAIEAALRASGGELSEAAFSRAATAVGQTTGQFLKKMGLATAEEAGTETIQEGMQIGAEYASDQQRGKAEFDPGKNWAGRLLSSAVIGGLVGGGTSAVLNTLHGSGDYHPAAFTALQDAYRTEGKAGLNRQLAELQDGLSLTDLTDDDKARTAQNLSQMAGVLTSMSSPYAQGKTAAQQNADEARLSRQAWNLYDLNYRAIPREQTILNDMQTRLQALTSEQPWRVDVDETGKAMGNENGPTGEYIDPVVARQEAAQLQPLAEDQARRVAFLTERADGLARARTPLDTAQYGNWQTALDQIGSVRVGDTVEGEGMGGLPVSGRVKAVSANGQVATVERDLTLAIKPDGSVDTSAPTTEDVEVGVGSLRRLGVTSTPDQNPVVSGEDPAAGDPVSVSTPVPDDYLPAAGESVVFADAPDRVQVVSEVFTDPDDGQTYGVVDQGGVRREVALTGDERVPILARVNAAEAEQLATDAANRQAFLTAKASAKSALPAQIGAAFEAMTDESLTNRIAELVDDNTDLGGVSWPSPRCWPKSGGCPCLLR